MFAAPPATCLQAACDLEGNISNVRALMEHPAFDITNPPACEHLFFGFADSVLNFHAEDGSGYAFMADAIIKVWHCLQVGVMRVSYLPGLMKVYSCQSHQQACTGKVSWWRSGMKAYALPGVGRSETQGRADDSGRDVGCQEGRQHRGKGVLQ